MIDDNDQTIRPTHTCFDDALEFLEDLAKAKNPMLFRMRLVHAICVAPDGHPFAHAWIEDNHMTVFFAGLVSGVKKYYCTDIVKFYKEMQVQDATKYTPAQAAIENHRTGHFGPWVERYREKELLK